MATISDTNKNFLLLGNLLVGTSNVIVTKEQSNCVSNIDGQVQEFQHPFMQCFAMYVGEALCFVIYFIYRMQNKENMEKAKQKAIEQGKIPHISPFLLIVPTVCDYVTSGLAFFALSLMPPSIYSMIRGGNVIVTAGFSILFLKAKLYRQHYLGLGLILLGEFLVGLSALITPSSDDDTGSQNIPLGIILLVTSFFTYSFQVTIEQKFFSKYELNPFQVVGIEGCWGMLISAATIFGIFDFIPCPDSMASDCPLDANGKPYLENGALFFKQIFTFSDQPNQPMLLIAIILGILTILFFNALQMTVTKYISSLARNVISVTSPFLVWIVSLSIGWEHFYFDKIYSWLQLLGFIVLSSGTLIYNEIIILPFLGFNKNLTKNVNAKKLEDEKIALLKDGEVTADSSNNKLIDEDDDF